MRSGNIAAPTASISRIDLPANQYAANEIWLPGTCIARRSAILRYEGATTPVRRVNSIVGKGGRHGR